MPNAETVEQVETTAPAPEEVVESTPEVTEQSEATGNLEDLDLNDVSAEDAEAFLYKGKALEIPDKTKSKPETEEVETTPTTEATEEADTIEEPEEEDDKPLPGRISTKQFDDEDQRVLRTMHALNQGKKPGEAGRVGINEVVAMLAKQDGKSETAAVQPEATPSPVEILDSKVTELETNLATLRQQKREAIENGESVLEIEDQIDDARDAIGQERTRLAIAQDRAERQQAETAATKASKANELVATAKGAAVAEFPSLKDKASPLGSLAAEVIAELKDPEHPDYGLLNLPSAARHVATEALDRIAKKEGITYAQAVSKYSAKAATPAPKAPVTPKPVTPAVRKVLPAVGAQPTTPPKAAPTAEDMLAQAEYDPEAAERFLYGGRKITTLR